MNRALIDHACAVQRWRKRRDYLRPVVCVAGWILIGYLLSRSV